jgi:hypothetical protein
VHYSAVLQLKLFGSKPLFVFRLKPLIAQTFLRLKPEAIHKKPEAIHKKPEATHKKPEAIHKKP